MKFSIIIIIFNFFVMYEWPYLREHLYSTSQCINDKMHTFWRKIFLKLGLYYELRVTKNLIYIFSYTHEFILIYIYIYMEVKMKKKINKLCDKCNTGNVSMFPWYFLKCPNPKHNSHKPVCIYFFQIFTKTFSPSHFPNGDCWLLPYIRFPFTLKSHFIQIIELCVCVFV